MMFLTLNSLACLKIFFIFELVESNNISKFFLSLLITSRVFWPIEPVDPNITIFFFFMISN